MKVMYLAAEATPYAKAGGLADVAGELPKALLRLGVDIRLVLPLHTTIELSSWGKYREGSITVQEQDGKWLSLDRSEFPVAFVDGSPMQQVPGIYGGGLEEGRKFTFYSLAALEICQQDNWIPDMVHANDWHAAAAVVWLAENRTQKTIWSSTRTLYTIHNLPYLGVGSGDAFHEYGIGVEPHPDLPDWAQTVPSARGLVAADWLSTVSPTYALDIQNQEYGSGLEQVFQKRQNQLTGILNGIDLSNWDPSRDPNLERNYDVESLDLRLENRMALRAELGLPDLGDTPIIGMITRLDRQKGVDLALDALDSLTQQAWQFILLGTGDPALEQASKRFKEQYHDRVSVNLLFDAELARRIYAGTDMFLIPSRYEPCGLTQMIAMRYGNVPVVRATGGLVDTVRSAESSNGTGFLFQDATTPSLIEGLTQALQSYRNGKTWRGIQETGMREDFSWRHSALAYRNLYEKIVQDISE